MRPDHSVAAVVVAYNGGDDLLSCVQSLVTQTIDGLEVIVVDNASTDGSIERAEATFGPTIRVIRRQLNGGYAAGANTGWRATEAPIVAILNQDLTLMPDCLEQMRQALLAESRDALVTPKIVLKSDPSRVNAIGNDVHLSGVAWCHGLSSPADDWHGVVEVTAISGAAFMTERTFLERLDGLEEAYFMYMEDVDLSLRARLSGGVCLASCDAVAIHGWSLALTPVKFGLLERNRRVVWKRFVGASRGLWLLFVQAEMMAWAFAAMRGRKYLVAKLGAYNGIATISPQRPSRNRLLPMLSRRHPYDVIFPGAPWLTQIGGFVDALLMRTLRIPASRTRMLNPIGIQSSAFVSGGTGSDPRIGVQAGDGRGRGRPH